MPSPDIVPQIEQALADGERYLDFAAMVDTLAALRSPYHQDYTLSERVGAVLLCVLWPDKPDEYTDAIRRFRMAFDGIADNTLIAARFANTIRPAAVLVPRPEDIFWDPTLYFGHETLAQQLQQP
ncbi:MAG: hypothetical protein AAFX44_03550 [Pseudomonadota bacterium]